MKSSTNYKNSSFAGCILFAAFLLLLSSCAPKPTLAKNSAYNRAGSREASEDIERCMNEAKVKLDGVATTIEKETRSRYAGAAVSAASSGITSGSTSWGCEREWLSL